MPGGMHAGHITCQPCFAAGCDAERDNTSSPSVPAVAWGVQHSACHEGLGIGLLILAGPGCSCGSSGDPAHGPMPWASSHQNNDGLLPATRWLLPCTPCWGCGQCRRRLSIATWRKPSGLEPAWISGHWLCTWRWRFLCRAFGASDTTLLMAQRENCGPEWLASAN